jgi:hypothetical protein
MLKSDAEYRKGTGEEALGKLERFFALIDSARLFDDTDPRYFIRLRQEIWDSLIQVLLWKRPFLESAKGLGWPYQALKERVSIFEEISGKQNSAFLRHQARLFLAILPFPGQWRWLIRAEREVGDDDEIGQFFKIEKQDIREKLYGKREKQFKLRHFCQILKKPRLPREKGVLRIFSLPYLFIDPKLLTELNRQYFLFVEPVAGVIFRHAWWRYFSTLEDPCLFGVSSEEDATFLQNQPGTLTTSLAHGDFLDNDLSVDIGKEKEFDIVYNATYDEMPRKRQTFMLELLQHPPLRHATALFLGRGKKENVDAFNQQVRQAGLTDRVTVMSNLRRVDVPKQLARCRIGVHLSIHENGCRCIYEFLRSDLPIIISSTTAGVNMEIITPQTGMAAQDSDLPEAISQVLQHREQFSPRSWFLEHSGTLHSTEKLNAQLKAIFLGLGYEWTDDIIPLGSSGANRYMDISHYERFRPELEALLKFFSKWPHIPIRISID